MIIIEHCFDALSSFLNRKVESLERFTIAFYKSWALGVSFKSSTRSDAISKKLQTIDFIRHYLIHQISYFTTTLWGNKTKERNYSKYPGLRTIFF